MELTCLSCGDPVDPREVKLYYRVFVCQRCYDKAENFVVAVHRDLRLLELASVEAIRHGLLKGALANHDPDNTSIRGRLVRLIEWSLRCPETHQDSSTPETSTPKLNSGECIEPNAHTQAADGEKSSSTPDP